MKRPNVIKQLINIFKKSQDHVIYFIYLFIYSPYTVHVHMNTLEFINR